MKYLTIALFLTSFNSFALDTFTSGQVIPADKINANFTELSSPKPRIQLERSAALTVAQYSSVNIDWQANAFANKITATGTNVKFQQKGIYEITVSFRNRTDVWTRLSVRDSLGNIKGQSVEFGGAPSASSVTFLFEVSDETLNHHVTLSATNVNAVSVDAPPVGARSIVAVIKKID